MGFISRLELKVETDLIPETILRLQLPDGDIEYGLVTSYNHGDRIAVIMIYDEGTRKRLLKDEIYAALKGD